MRFVTWESIAKKAGRSPTDRPALGKYRASDGSLALLVECVKGVLLPLVVKVCTLRAVLQGVDFGSWHVGHYFGGGIGGLFVLEK
jgi:hypothetical protein